MAQGFRGKKSEFDQKMIDLRRVARVVAGGRRFSFRATLVIGDRHGRVGVGTGKGTDAALSLEKALREAKKNMFTVPLKKNGTIPFLAEPKSDAANYAGCASMTASRWIYQFTGPGQRWQVIETEDTYLLAKRNEAAKADKEEAERLWEEAKTEERTAK